MDINDSFQSSKCYNSKLQNNTDQIIFMTRKADFIFKNFILNSKSCLLLTQCIIFLQNTWQLMRSYWNALGY